MHAFATIAVKRDRLVSKDVIDQLIHSRLAEGTSLARLALKGSRALNLFDQEVVDVLQVARDVSQQ